MIKLLREQHIIDHGWTLALSRKHQLSSMIVPGFYYLSSHSIASQEINCLRLIVNGNLPSFIGKTIRGIKTLFLMLDPVIIWASITRPASCVTISLIPLHKPTDGLRFHSNIIRVSIFKVRVWEGTLLNSSWLINSGGYNKSVLSLSPDDVSKESVLR